MNSSGITPVGDRILILPEEIEEKTEGGIIIPDTERERHGLGQVFGTLVAVGPDSWTDYSGPFAQVGDRILFAKYGGLMFEGQDGKSYRICNDTDITAVCNSKVKYTQLSARKRINE